MPCGAQQALGDQLGNRGAAAGTTHVSAALLALLLFFQTGLGYVGRDSTLAASWHIPLGVAAFGLATAALLGSILVVGGAHTTSAPSSDRT